MSSPDIYHSEKVEVSETGRKGQKVSAKDKQEKNRYFFASQWQLMWWRFRRHKLAMIAVLVLGILYTIGIFCEFFAPYGPVTAFFEHRFAPPQRVHFFSLDGGGLQFEGPYVYGLTSSRDPETLRRIYAIDESVKYPIDFFVEGEEIKVLGLFRTNIHFFGAAGPVLLFGTDSLGRDLFSRAIYASRISLTIGLVGVFLTFILGLIIGGISGYFGGGIDNVIQRFIELLMSIPTIPLWMALSAALPRTWSSIQNYFAITIVLSILGWTGLARVVRGKLLALREEDFTIAAKVSGASESRIISKHLLPLFFSYIVVSLTLSIPRMILGETALSFLGLGIQPPAVSWGTLLKDAQHIITVAQRPWLLIPCMFVIVTVLMFNFVGDGLRDAADPYAVLEG
jgi:peptide/nickel transport system permease protein